MFNPKTNISDYDLLQLVNKSLEEKIAYLDRRMETFIYTFQFPPYQELKAKLQKELATRNGNNS